MSAVILKCLNQISTYLKISVKISVTCENMPTCTLKNSKTCTGFINIVTNMVKQSQLPLLGNNPEEECEVRQWLEYCVIYAQHCNTPQGANQILQELNEVLERCTYFIGNVLTIADIAIYYILHNLMTNLTYQQKEKYLNISRWFDNIQQNNCIRNKNSEVDFSTLFLTCISVH